MAHEIDRTKMAHGSAMFANKPAWHGLGTVVAGCQTTADALRIAGLEWEVHKCPLLAELPDGTTKLVPDRFGTYRSDTLVPLGAVGKTYAVLQNRDAFAIMDDVVGGQLAIWDACGSLRGGRTVWALAKLPGHLEVGSSDVLEKFVCITNSHDGTAAVRIYPTAVRVVCANTLRFSLTDRVAAERRGDAVNAGLRVRHVRGDLATAADDVRQLFGMANRRLELHAEQARTMAGRGVSSAEVADYFATITADRVPAARDRIVKELHDLFVRPTNAYGFGANVWTAYNAASEYADHRLRVLGAGEVRVERRFYSRLWGGGDAFKQRAWAAACELACVV